MPALDSREGPIVGIAHSSKILHNSCATVAISTCTVPAQFQFPPSVTRLKGTQKERQK